METDGAGHIWLTGFSGSGKSTVAPLLGHRLSIPVYDMDTMIEDRLSARIADVFQTHGEKAFRDVESRVLSELAELPRRSVVALGGGVLEREINRKVIALSGTLVYLRCARRELYRRLRHLKDRPLLHSRDGEAVSARLLKDKIGQLLDRRRMLYEQADVIVSTTEREPGEIAALIAEKLRHRHA